MDNSQQANLPVGLLEDGWLDIDWASPAVPNKDPELLEQKIIQDD